MSAIRRDRSSIRCLEPVDADTHGRPPPSATSLTVPPRVRAADEVHRMSAQGIRPQERTKLRNPLPSGIGSRHPACRALRGPQARALVRQFTATKEPDPMPLKSPAPNPVQANGHRDEPVVAARVARGGDAKSTDARRRARTVAKQQQGAERIASAAAELSRGVAESRRRRASSRRRCRRSPRARRRPPARPPRASPSWRACEERIGRQKAASERVQTIVTTLQTLRGGRHGRDRRAAHQRRPGIRAPGRVGDGHRRAREAGGADRRHRQDRRPHRRPDQPARAQRGDRGRAGTASMARGSPSSPTRCARWRRRPRRARARSAR